MTASASMSNMPGPVEMALRISKTAWLRSAAPPRSTALLEKALPPPSLCLCDWNPGMAGTMGGTKSYETRSFRKLERGCVGDQPQNAPQPHRCGTFEERMLFNAAAAGLRHSRAPFTSWSYDG